MMFGLKPELLSRFLPEPFDVLRTANQTYVRLAISDGGQAEITIVAQLERHMGLGIGRKMGLKTDPVSASFRVFRQQPGDRRVAPIRGD